MAATLTNVLVSIDSGSNSFRLQICENHNDQLKAIDSSKQMARLAVGSNEQKDLNGESQEHALERLAKFGERLHGFQPGQVRIVAANTFRVAKDINYFILRAEAVLGFPVEVITGREEVRLIYTGTAYTLPPNGDRVLVIGIDGGPTEFAIGSDPRPIRTENLPLGRVTYSMRFFQDKIGNKGFQAAVAAACNEAQHISKLMKRTGQDSAIDTSGPAKPIHDVLAAEHPQGVDITYGGMKKLAERITTAGSVKKAKFESLKPERVEIFTGGLAAIMAAFEELKICKITVAEAILCDGVFYDLIGRSLNEDMREQTMAESQHRYRISLNQANRVVGTARKSMESLCHGHNVPAQSLTLWEQYLSWVGRPREIGLDIPHIDYHKHSAYILENADMSGLSREEQSVLAQLVLGHCGEVRKMTKTVGNNEMAWYAILSLRLAALFRCTWMPSELPLFTQLRPDSTGKGFMLRISRNWLEQHPLIGDALAYESMRWQKIDIPLDVQLQ